MFWKLVVRVYLHQSNNTISCYTLVSSRFKRWPNILSLVTKETPIFVRFRSFPYCLDTVNIRDFINMNDIKWMCLNQTSSDSKRKLNYLRIVRRGYEQPCRFFVPCIINSFGSIKIVERTILHFLLKKTHGWLYIKMYIFYELCVCVKYLYLKLELFRFSFLNSFP